MTNLAIIKYRPDIDGLRALAVASVILYHAGLGCEGGFVGVDVFFVISGYLISGIILRELDAGTFRLADFWERRVRRIAPAMLAVVFSTFAAAWWLLLPNDFKSFGHSMVAQAALSSNIWFWRDSGYFSQAAEVKPLLHTWSLAVEEQFYLLFPFLLIAVHGLSRNARLPVIAVLSAVSLAAAIYASYHCPSAGFFLLPTRAWELLAGTLVAALPARFSPPGIRAESMSCLGLLAILVAVVYYNPTVRFPGASALLPCGGAVFVILGNRGALTRSGRLLGMSPLRVTGLMSYSLYLWHWPIFAFVKYWASGPLPLHLRVWMVAAAVLLGGLSWLFVETPFRRRQVFSRRTPILVAAAVSLVSIALVGILIHTADGVPSRLPKAAEIFATGGEDKATEPVLNLADASKGRFAELGLREEGHAIGLFVWGDSHAWAIMPIISQMCLEKRISGQGAAALATAPLIDYESTGPLSLKRDSIPFNQTILEHIRKHHIPKIIIAARWKYYRDWNGGVSQIKQTLMKTISLLVEAGASVWIMESVPCPDFDVPKALSYRAMFGDGIFGSAVPVARFVKSPVNLSEILAGSGVSTDQILDPAKYLVDSSGNCRLESGGKAIYIDGNHLSTHGCMLLRPLFEPVFLTSTPKGLPKENMPEAP